MYISQDPIRLKGGHYLYSFVKNANRYLAPLGLTFEELAKERERRRLPIAGSQTDKSTLAKLEIDRNSYYGVNKGDQNPKTEITLEKVNAITKTHAEADATQKAINGCKIGSAKTAVLWVDRDPCPSCGKNGGLRSLARNLGVEELIVHPPSGTKTYKPNMLIKKIL